MIVEIENLEEDLENIITYICNNLGTTKLKLIKDNDIFTININEVQYNICSVYTPVYTQAGLVFSAKIIQTDSDGNIKEYDTELCLSDIPLLYVFNLLTRIIEIGKF